MYYKKPTQKDLGLLSLAEVDRISAQSRLHSGDPDLRDVLDGTALRLGLDLPLLAEDRIAPR